MYGGTLGLARLAESRGVGESAGAVIPSHFQDSNAEVFQKDREIKLLLERSTSSPSAVPRFRSRSDQVHDVNRRLCLRQNATCTVAMHVAVAVSRFQQVCPSRPGQQRPWPSFLLLDLPSSQLQQHNRTQPTRSRKFACQTC